MLEALPGDLNVVGDVVEILRGDGSTVPLALGFVVLSVLAGLVVKWGAKVA